MSLTFNLLDDTRITAYFGKEGKRLEVQPKTITNFTVPEGFYVVFAGEGFVNIQLDRYDTTLDNEFSRVQTLEANQPLVMNVNKKDVVKISDVRGTLFANQQFITVNSGFNFTIDDTTQPIIFTDSRTLTLGADKGEIGGTATVPSFVKYNNNGQLSTNQQELVGEDTYVLPYNSLVNLDANPAENLKYFDSTNDDTELPQELFLTEYVDSDLVGKGNGTNTGYWIFIIILIALLVFLIMRYRNSHR